MPKARFSAPALPAGVYEVRVELKGFRTVVREATVETGLTTTADMRMPIGQTAEVVNVEAATAQVEYEKHAIDGVVTRTQIQDLPLNGRSYLQLASIEPGVSVGTGIDLPVQLTVQCVDSGRRFREHRDQH